jgi:hypothetical protein
MNQGEEIAFVAKLIAGSKEVIDLGNQFCDLIEKHTADIVPGVMAIAETHDDMEEFKKRYPELLSQEVRMNQLNKRLASLLM